jgi:hypothetical protein
MLVHTIQSRFLTFWLALAIIEVEYEFNNTTERGMAGWIYDLLPPSHKTDELE